ncbi:MAG: hypothetical protein GY801_20040 [bacterium]|nr:hypothetical protein [bacterium]
MSPERDTHVFGDATLTAALRDRVTHQAVIRNCRWERYRLHQSLRQQVTTSADAGPVPKNC